MLFYRILSVQDMATLKVATEICNNTELKREILCAPGSDYDINKGNDQFRRKKLWSEIVEKKGTVILENLGVAKQLQEKVLGNVLLVGMRMLTWAEYHEGTLGLSRKYSINFLNSSFFTQRGIIDNKKAAEELMSDKNLSIQQKYKLSCLYCFTHHIPALHIQMKEDKERFSNNGPRWIIQPGLVRFWSYYTIGKVDEIRGEKTVDLYRLEKAVKSGSKAAVEYCLEKTNLKRKKNAIVNAAVEAMRNCLKARNDWIVFRDTRYDDSEETWVPSNYYVDIVSFLLPKMTKSQQIKFLKKDIEGDIYEEVLVDDGHSRILEYFLRWPYQDYFMKTAELMWEFLPERDYAILLLKVCEKIESEKENLNYGEQKSYDYRGLLKEFWCQSPERYKRYVFSNEVITYRSCKTGRVNRVKTGVALFTMLITLHNFSHEDRKNIELIFSSATDKEKENIVCSVERKGICKMLMQVGQRKILDWFVLNCFSSKEQANKFKRELIFATEAQEVCIDFVKNDKWKAAESFIKWSSLPEAEINQLKKKMISSIAGRCVSVDLISYKKVEAVEKFIRWWFPSEEEVKTFKKELIFSTMGLFKCANLVIEDQLDLVSEFINLCLSSEEEIRELKKNVAYETGSSYFEELITGYPEDDIFNEIDNNTVGCTTKIKGGKWEEVEKFLTWCFSSEEEISEYKKNKLLERSGIKIHFYLIKSSQWEEAETFFAWLGLSEEEIKGLKKDTLFYHEVAGEMFLELMFSKEDDARFADYGSKQEAIELLLRWYLTDKRAVLEFKDEFKSEYENDINKVEEDILNYFDLMIEQRLGDLDKEKIGVKYKKANLDLGMKGLKEIRNVFPNKKGLRFKPRK